MSLSPMRSLGVLLLCLGLMSGCQPAPPERSEPGSLSLGQQLFKTHCLSCHAGIDNPTGPDSRVLQSPQLQSEETFTNLLRHPFSAAMPAFDEKTLDSKVVHELYLYLQSEKESSQ